jgi:hypothetical protein
LGLLALVAGQDVEPAEGSDGTDGRWRIARRVAEDRVISVVDPDARHTRKSPENRRDGYRAHVAAEPETGIITDEALTKAAGTENSDPALAEKFLAAEVDTEVDTEVDGEAEGDAEVRVDAQVGVDGEAEGDAEVEAGQEPCTWFGDSAYGTGDLRGAIADAGHQAVIKPKPLRPAVEGGFSVDDFVVDEHAGTMACPAGHIRPITPHRSVIFGALCRGCPLRARCTTSRAGRTLSLHQRDALLRQARREWAANPGLVQDYRAFRPNVERVICQIASRGGRRVKLRYRGTTKNRLS